MEVSGLVDQAGSVLRLKGTALRVVVPVVADPANSVPRLVVPVVPTSSALRVVVLVVADPAGAGRVVLADLPRAWVIRPRSVT